MEQHTRWGVLVLVAASLVACELPGGTKNSGKTAASGTAAANANPEAGKACTEDGKQICTSKKSALVCDAAKWTPMTCRGPKGCRDDKGKANCDARISEAGALCLKEKTSACTADQKNRLDCRNGEWFVRAHCRGKKGCYLDDEKNLLYCDQAVAYVGDVCMVEKGAACSHDGKAFLRCKNGKYSFETRCLGAKGCTYDYDKDQVSCEH